MGWFYYDQDFRRRMASCPDLGWDQKEIQLWVQHMGKIGGEHRDYTYKSQKFGADNKDARPFQRCPFRQSFRGGRGGGQRGGAHKFNTATCRLFNGGTCSWGKSCKFRHNCNKCGANHPALTCSSSRDPPLPLLRPTDQTCSSESEVRLHVPTPPMPPPP